MSIIDKVRSFLAPSAPSTTFTPITVTSALDYAELPKGFFNVETMSGKKSLGYNGGFLNWRVGSVVVDGGKRIAAPENRDELPTIRLNFQRPAREGVQHVNGFGIIDTDTLDGDSSVVWDGAKPSSGVQWV